MTEAEKAFSAACDAAARKRSGIAICLRHLFVYRLGDLQVAQGNLSGALKSYEDALTIANRLAQSDSRHRRLAWHDLGFIRKRWATFTSRRATSPGRWTSYSDRPRDYGGPLIENPIPGMPNGSAISQCRRRSSATCTSRRATWAAALTSYSDSLCDLWAAWRNPIPGMPNGSAISQYSPCLIAPAKYRIARYPRRGADLLPRHPRDCRPLGAIRPRQRRLAARSFDIPREGRRLVLRAGRPRWGAGAPTATAWPFSRNRLDAIRSRQRGMAHDLAVSHQKIKVMEHLRMATSPKR